MWSMFGQVSQRQVCGEGEGQVCEEGEGQVCEEGEGQVLQSQVTYHTHIHTPNIKQHSVKLCCESMYIWIKHIPK